MKILVVCQYYYPENFVITKICEELFKRGHDVTVLTGLPNYGYGRILDEYKNVRHENVNGINIERVKIYAKTKKTLSIITNYLSFWINSKKWVKKCKTKYDVVLSMSLSPVTILAAANLYKRKFCIKHICYCVDLWPESVVATNYTNKKSILYRILFNWSKKLYMGADDIIVGSPSFKNYFKDVLGINSDFFPIVVQPSLDENVLDICRHDDKKEFHLLYCGNIGKLQMIEMIPEVMSHLKKHDIYFDIIGKGYNEKKLVENIGKYGVESKVHFYGPMQYTNAISYFKECDAIYVSLKADGYVGKTIPNKLVMSMAMGKPIIGVLEGDGKELIKSANGGISSNFEVRNIVNAILNMYNTDKKELISFGLNNRKYYEDNLSLKKCVDSIEKILKKI